jgi:hypothetical protein
MGGAGARESDAAGFEITLGQLCRSSSAKGGSWFDGLDEIKRFLGRV